MSEKSIPQRESELYDKKWVIGYANTSKAKCKDKDCMEENPEIMKGELRIGRRYPSPFNENEIAVNWFHARCMFNQQLRARNTTQVIERPEDMDAFQDLDRPDQQFIEQLISYFQNGILTKLGRQPKTTISSKTTQKSTNSRIREGKSSTGDSKSAATIKAKEIEKKKKKAESGRRDIGRVIML